MRGLHSLETLHICKHFCCVPCWHTVILSYHHVPLSHHSVPLSHHSVPLSHHNVPLSDHSAPLSHHSAPLSHHNDTLSHHRAPLSHHNAFISQGSSESQNTWGVSIYLGSFLSTHSLQSNSPTMVRSSSRWTSKDLAVSQSHDASRQKRVSASFQCPYVGLQERVWPRFKVVSLQKGVWP